MKRTETAYQTCQSDTNWRTKN